MSKPIEPWLRLHIEQLCERLRIRGKQNACAVSPFNLACIAPGCSMAVKCGLVIGGEDDVRFRPNYPALACSTYTCQ